ncbi:hypothetical protein MWU57_04545 [Isoptericola sp. S6320L]|uniref:hypothetical protein n=1 Tax=Isoptericola sp. S6320L TaxID=2926411 RepID=UPI001FF20267|nr:hypothetical protein [Isoptericola sp. S6320L]MCK0116295.1 hypothetical protein [Isoptericola sp. S6320L]
MSKAKQPLYHDFQPVANLIQKNRQRYDVMRSTRIQIDAAHDPSVAELPIYVVPVFDLKSSEVVESLRELYRAQSMLDKFRVLLFTDSDIYKAVRPYGFPVESVVSEANWILEGKVDWEDYVLESLAWVLERYGAAGLLLRDAQGSLVPDLVRHGLAASNVPRTSADSTSDPDGAVWPSWRAWAAHGDGLGESYVRTSTSEHSVVATDRLGEVSAVFLLEADFDVPAVLTGLARRARWNVLELRKLWGGWESQVLASRVAASTVPHGVTRILFVHDESDSVTQFARSFDFVVAVGKSTALMRPVYERHLASAADRWYEVSWEDVVRIAGTFATQCMEIGVRRYHYPA